MAFADRVAIITGASSGLGWALARTLAAGGARVGVLARRKDKLEQLAGAIRHAGGTVSWAVADVGDREQTAGAVQQLTGELGPVDLMMANAGVGMPTLVKPMNTRHIEQMWRINFLGVVYCVEAVLPSMLERRQGHLAAVSSLAAYKGLPGESAYCATKAAVNVFMEGLRIQLRDKGIAVTTVCPGFVRTPMTEVNKFHMPWLLEADDAARRIVRALERRKAVYDFPWQLSWLMKLTRWLPDWMVARSMQQYNEDPPFPPESPREVTQG